MNNKSTWKAFSNSITMSPHKMSDSGPTGKQMSIYAKRGRGEKEGDTNTEREREKNSEREKKRNKEKERGREGRNFPILFSERCISWTLQDTVTFEVKILNHQLEDLALSFTSNSLSRHVLVLQKKREANSLLGFKDSGREIGQEKKQKTSLSWTIHWRKLTFPK